MRRLAEVATASRGGGGPILQAYLRLDDALAGIGRARLPGETHRELPGRLTGLADAHAVAAVAAAISLLERECFGVEAPSDLDVSSAVMAFDALYTDLRLAATTGRKAAAISVG